MATTVAGNTKRAKGSKMPSGWSSKQKMSVVTVATKRVAANAQRPTGPQTVSKRMWKSLFTVQRSAVSG
jgi:hypothetical protein